MPSADMLDQLSKILLALSVTIIIGLIVTIIVLVATTSSPSYLLILIAVPMVIIIDAIVNRTIKAIALRFREKNYYAEKMSKKLKNNGILMNIVVYI